MLLKMSLPVQLVVITKQSQLDKLYKKMGKPATAKMPPNGGAVAEWWDNPHGQHYELVIFGKLRRAEALGIIVHECTHVKQHVMESIGETSPSKEFEAYLMQSIFNEIFRKYYGK